MTIANVSAPGSETPEFVISNEATGRYFGADLATVRFVDALRRTGDAGVAAGEAQIQRPHAEALVQKFNAHGIVTGLPGGGAAPAPRGPMEGRLISFRTDLFDASGVARRYAWLGRALFSGPGFVIWLVLLIAALVALARNGDKVTLSLQQVSNYGWTDAVAFLGLFVALKLFHELGHILAYWVFCQREGHAPGPVRTGIMVFAATPFPFTDVTGAWRLRSRWRRAAIGAGGIYFEVFAVSLLTLIWAATSTGAWHALILQVAVFSGAMTLLFNLNPAIKLDGYYIMTDLFRLPNLYNRASEAARIWAARAIGASLPPPGRGALAYWVISYAYRWTIFATVFWIAYRFDPRLAPVVAIVAVLLLVVRPVVATWGFAKARGIQMARATGLGVVIAAMVAALFVPFPARLLMDGQLMAHRTDYVRATEPALLSVDTAKVGALRLDQPDLDQTREDLTLRREILANLNRTVTRNAAEKAAVAQDLSNMDRLLDEVRVRLAALQVAVPDAAVWTPLAAEHHNGAWVLPTLEQPLGAVSRSVAPYLRLTLPQGRLDASLGEADATRIEVRLASDPACQFSAVLDRPLGESIVVGADLEIEARPSDALPACAAAVPTGAATVARIPLPAKSLAGHIRTTAARLLQNRLPIERNETP